MFVQLIYKVLLKGLCPGAVLRIGEEGNLTAVSQKTKFYRAVSKLVDDGILVLPAVFIVVDQNFSVVIYAVEVKHPAGTAQGHLNIRIDLHLERAVRDEEILVFIHTEDCDAEAGCQAGCKADHPAHLFLSVLRIFQWKDLFNNFANLIADIGSFDETAFIVQEDGIGAMHFHY